MTILYGYRKSIRISEITHVQKRTAEYVLSNAPNTLRINTHFIKPDALTTLENIITCIHTTRNINAVPQR